MNLSQMIIRVRQDLQDTDQNHYRWTDGEIEAAIQRCVWEYSLKVPLEQESDIPTTEGDSELDISDLVGLLQVVSVEFPLGRKPRHLQRFERYAGRLYMEDAGDGTDARVRWLKLHSITVQGSTIPPEHEEIIILGATGYLAMSASAYTVDKATISGRFATQGYSRWAGERLGRYDQKLKEISRRAKLIAKSIYTSDD